MNSRIVALHNILIPNELAGKFLALHEDGSLSVVDTGEDDKGPAVQITPLRVVQG